MVAQGGWEVVLRYFNGQPFGVEDPVFNREVSFYVFSLPFLEQLRGWLTSTVIISLIGTFIIYLLNYNFRKFEFQIARPVLAHIGGLIVVMLGLFAWGYWLGIWELVFSNRGVVFGASYTDMHASLPAQWILIGIVIVFMGIVLYAIFRRKLRWIAYGVGGWIVVSIIVSMIYPALVQRFQVQPNELALETQYIEYNIEYTRQAFGLNRIEEQAFPAEKAPTYQDIQNNPATISNIRLWDHRPLLDTYNQIQSIRLYYDFNDVDVDRYTIDGNYRQVMLAARELSPEKLAQQAQTWVNRQLQFTHGYGAVLSPVNEVTDEGLPVLLVKDIPPTGSIEIDQPQIYFGEKTSSYVIVKTNTEEFDYPMGNDNIYGRWEGKNGVSLGSFMRRLVYAWQFGDMNILISGELNSNSEILYYRNIKDRVKHLAPFLMLDDDPYLVIMDGKLFWIQDAYTTTTRYPYSEPLGSGVNYIRNSVKAVIDAYDGSVTFYVTEPDDAVIKTYESIFPDLFVSMDKMPDFIRAHLRYPEGMFNVQSMMYQSYHMRDARVFYNKEDLWAVPKEVYYGNEQNVDPYYVIMKLKGEEEEEFLLMLPFTPVNKNNTIGWLAARCDGENYGKLIAYYFPKEHLVYGPSQIENRIQQDTVITEQLALWGRGGSRVIRGNLLMIPIGNSNLFVEPVFLQADAGGLPELKRIIVATGEEIAMEPSLGESLSAIFGRGVTTAVTPPSTTPETPAEPSAELPVPVVPEKPAAGTVDAEIAALIDEAQRSYDDAQQYLKEGDWAGYGNALDKLKSALDRLAELTGK